MVEIEKPRIVCMDSPDDVSYGKYVVEPLERGYGTTLGNSLRRILLSSLPGTAATSIKIAGVQHEFSTIPGVRVVIIAGNHDRIRSNSALMSFTWCPNVTFLMSEELSSVYFRDLNLEVHGFSYHTAEINEARLNGIKAPDDGRIHVLLVGEELGY